MNKASRIRLAKQLLHCARMVLDAEHINDLLKNKNQAKTILAINQHSGRDYKEFKEFIFEQCTDAKQELAKYGIKDIIGTGYEIHHMKNNPHYIQRGHNGRYYKALTKLIKDEVSEIKVLYRVNDTRTVTKQQIKQEINNIVFIPKWFHDEFTTDAELKLLSTRSEVYKRMRQLLLIQESYQKIKGIRFQNTIRGAANAIYQLASVAEKIDSTEVLQDLQTAYNYIRQSVIKIVKDMDS